jgi:hypothetical protein
MVQRVFNRLLFCLKFGGVAAFFLFKVSAQPNPPLQGTLRHKSVASRP